MQQTIKLGNLTLPRTAGLAPMAGVADRAYRILCKEHQAALLVSEMISAKGLCYGDPKTAQFCTITDAERACPDAAVYNAVYKFCCVHVTNYISRVLIMQPHEYE